jgi:hypothetical protein
VTISESTELCARTNPGFSWGGSLIDGFCVGRYLAIADDFRVNKDCVRGRIQALVVEAVSLMLFELAATQFSPVISESTGTVCADKSMSQLLSFR